MTNPPDIILASGSAARQEMLSNAGITYTSIPADLDEDALIKTCTDKGQQIEIITEKLAEAKAVHVSTKHPDNLIIGSDQTLDFQGRILSKAKDAQAAKIKLKELRANTHTLWSAVALAYKGEIIFSHTQNAKLTMHDFDDAFLESYIQQDPDALTSCVGGYKIEGAGAWLFSSVTGDLFTIMGMPLLPLLSFLRTEYGIKP